MSGAHKQYAKTGTNPSNYEGTDDMTSGGTNGGQYRGKSDGDMNTKNLSVGDQCKINHGRGGLKHGGKVVQGDETAHHNVKGRKHGGRVTY